MATIEIFTNKEISVLDDLLSQEKIKILEDCAKISQELRTISDTNETPRNQTSYRSKLLGLRSVVNTIRDIEGKLGL